jgi:hypothetical protein
LNGSRGFPGHDIYGCIGAEWQIYGIGHRVTGLVCGENAQNVAQTFFSKLMQNFYLGKIEADYVGCFCN